MEPQQKLRLKVSTNTGLNIMCTVNKDWTVDALYPHITKLYKEVTEDQGEVSDNLRITMLKKSEFFIPKSQLVGEIFVDGDDVSCHVDFQPRSSKGKKEKKHEKREEKDMAGEKQSSSKKDKNGKDTKQKSQEPKKKSHPEEQNQKPKQPVSVPDSDPSPSGKKSKKNKPKKEKKREEGHIPSHQDLKLLLKSKKEFDRSKERLQEDKEQSSEIKESERPPKKRVERIEESEDEDEAGPSV